MSHKLVKIIKDDVMDALRRVEDMGHTSRHRLELQVKTSRDHRSRMVETDSDLASGVPDADKPDVAPLRVGPVKELDVDTYQALKDREVVGDKMQHDHIPSSAAIRRARELELGRKLKPHEAAELHRNAIAVELRDELHALSRTFRGRNTPARIELDAKDLAAAAARDYDTLRNNLVASGDYSHEQIDAVIDQLRELNGKLGR